MCRRPWRPSRASHSPRSRFADRWAVREPLDSDAFARYLKCFLRDGVIEATCADYRAAATTDLELDRSDAAAGRLLGMPVLALWGSEGYVGRSFDVLDVWRDYAVDLAGHAIRSDHYVPEEAPDECADALFSFFTGIAPDRKVSS